MVTQKISSMYGAHSLNNDNNTASVIPQTGSLELEAIIPAGTETGELLRTINWASTPLGSPATWPQSLFSTLSICMNTRFPIAIYWGREHVLIYNDAWIPMVGSKHPMAFGRAAREVWPEIQDAIEEQYACVLNGQAISGENERFALLRDGYLKECYYDYTLSPVRGEGGRVVGIFNPVIETTLRVVAARRSRILHELTEATAAAESVEQVCRTANQVLTAAFSDVAFCLIYLVKDDHRHAQLIDVHGLADDNAACPRLVDLTQRPTHPWPLSLAFQTQQLQVVDDLHNKISGFAPHGAWPEPARAAVVVPIRHQPVTVTPAGLLILGVSPRVAFDEQYQEFANQIAACIAAAIANVRTRDQQSLALQVRLANLANVAPVALYELRRDPDGNATIPYSTPAIMDICGLTPNELARDLRGAAALVHPDDRALVNRLFQETRQGSGVLHAQWRTLHPTKGEIWVEVHSTPEIHPDGSIVWYGYVLDITLRCQLEQALRDDKNRYRQMVEEVQRLNAELEQRVESRTAALTEANHELEVFAYTVSHDLRAPLRNINGLAQVLIDDEGERLSPEGLSIVGRIKEAGNKLDQLIQDILEYGRAGQLQMLRHSIDMSKLARGIADELQSHRRHTQIVIDALPDVEGDITMLRQVLQNLISNALKFSSRQATPAIHIGAQQQTGETVYFVRDNGVGFEMGQATNLFNMFRRLHSERDFPGTGVGLAIVKRVIERHGGRIWVESSAGKGATFFFTLGRIGSNSTAETL